MRSLCARLRTSDADQRLAVHLQLQAGVFIPEIDRQLAGPAVHWSRNCCIPIGPSSLRSPWTAGTWASSVDRSPNGEAVCRPIMSAAISLELLDSGQGYSVQSWEFGADSLVQIGRSKECEVAIANPFVSRSHAYLHRVASTWYLVTVSPGGAYIDGLRVEHSPLTDGTVFRLAEKGPLLRFRYLPEAPGEANNSTMQFDPDRVILLTLRERERDAEVEEIAASPYFQELQRKARLLRARSGG